MAVSTNNSNLSPDWDDIICFAIAIVFLVLVLGSIKPK